MLLRLCVLAALRATEFLKRVSKAKLPALVQGTVKGFCPTGGW